MEKIVIIGFGGHAKSVTDTIIAAGKYEIAGYTDIEDQHVENMEYLGTDDILQKLYTSGIQSAAFGLGYMGHSKLRDKLYEKLCEIGFSLPAIIDPSAIVAPDVLINEGTFVGKRAAINARASIGKMCIINTGTIIEHESKIDHFTHIAVGAVLCGNVVIGDHCLIGANSTVLQGIEIGSGTIVGAGSVVTKDIHSNSKAVGVPARIMK